MVITARHDQIYDKAFRASLDLISPNRIRSSHYTQRIFKDYLFFKLCRRELYVQGVSVHVVEPGVFDTGMLNRAKPTEFFQKSFDTLPDNVKDYYGRDYVQKCKIMSGQSSL